MAPGMAGVGLGAGRAPRGPQRPPAAAAKSRDPASSCSGGAWGTLCVGVWLSTYAFSVAGLTPM